VASGEDVHLVGDAVLVPVDDRGVEVAVAVGVLLVESTQPFSSVS
jgi:hypothetical protein